MCILAINSSATQSYGTRDGTQTSRETRDGTQIINYQYLVSFQFHIIIIYKTYSVKIKMHKIFLYCLIFFSHAMIINQMIIWHKYGTVSWHIGKISSQYVTSDNLRILDSIWVNFSRLNIDFEYNTDFPLAILFKWGSLKCHEKLFSWVLWHIIHCRLLNARSCLYVYISNMICKHFLDNISKSQLNDFKYGYVSQTIQLNISHLFIHS